MNEFMLEFQRITSVDDPRWQFVERVMDSSFPSDERRKESLQRHLAANDPRFAQCVVYDRGRAVAVISYWLFSEGNYLEHIATDPEARGGGLGAAIIKHLMATVAPAWFGEVELPNDEMSRRRIGFYERLGFVGYPDFHYIQPSYGEGKETVPMMIMAMGGAKLSDEKLSRLVDELLREVYSVN